MPLTTELIRNESPIRQWYDEQLDPVAAEQFIKWVNDRLAGCRIDRSHFGDVNYMVQGTAFNYLVYFRAPGWKGAGLPCFNRMPSLHREQLLAMPNDASDEQVARAALHAAFYDQLFRAGTLDNVGSGFVRSGYLETQFPKAWIDDLLTMKPKDDRFTPPDAQLAPDLSPDDVSWRAEADYIGADGCLWEFKSSFKARPFTMDMLIQMLSYCLIDYHPTSFGLYMSRHHMALQWNLADWVRYYCYTPNLADLRWSFDRNVLDAYRMLERDWEDMSGMEGDPMFYGDN